MAKLIDREYPFGSERKEFRLVMRALQAGWINGEAASDVIDQAVAHALTDGLLRESLSLLRTAVTIEKRRQQLVRDESNAELRRARSEILTRRIELAKERLRLRNLAMDRPPKNSDSE